MYHQFLDFLTKITTYSLHLKATQGLFPKDHGHLSLTFQFEDQSRLSFEDISISLFQNVIFPYLSSQGRSSQMKGQRSVVSVWRPIMVSFRAFGGKKFSMMKIDI